MRFVPGRRPPLEIPRAAGRKPRIRRLPLRRDAGRERAEPEDRNFRGRKAELPACPRSARRPPKPSANRKTASAVLRPRGLVRKLRVDIFSHGRWLGAAFPSAVPSRRPAGEGMGVTYVDVTVRNPAQRARSWTGSFLVDTGAIDSLAPHLEAIGLKPTGRRAYAAADSREVEMDVALGELEIMGELSGGVVRRRGRRTVARRHGPRIRRDRSRSPGPKTQASARGAAARFPAGIADATAAALPATGPYRPDRCRRRRQASSWRRGGTVLPTPGSTQPR